MRSARDRRLELFIQWGAVIALVLGLLGLALGVYSFVEAHEAPHKVISLRSDELPAPPL